MFTTTEFARIGMVSVRMLRCYEATGLLLPRLVDPVTARGCYEANQLPRLNRILALTDLGFTLPQVWAILETEVSESELRGMLRLRRAELTAKITAETARLERVEVRLATIAKEGYLPRNEVVTKEVAPIRIAELAAIADNYAASTLDQVIRPLQSALTSRMDAAGVRPDGPALAWYDTRPGYEPRSGQVTETVTVHAAFPVSLDAASPEADRIGPGRASDFAIADLPGAGTAATIVHHGPDGRGRDQLRGAGPVDRRQRLHQHRPGPGGVPGQPGRRTRAVGHRAAGPHPGRLTQLPQAPGTPHRGLRDPWCAWGSRGVWDVWDSGVWGLGV